ncbi:MAG: GDP-mannose 4,6-dehydratase [Armatimonadota bacterium]|nr:GDP-mannose 4,6-dehydratase [bacterium]
MKSALVTGGAGFIGSHLVDSLLMDGWRVTVVDNFDPFYDPVVKWLNIGPHFDYDTYTLIQQDIRDRDSLREHLSGEFDVIVHIAAKAGVRPSIQDPLTYQDVNVAGTQNMLELAREWGVKQFVFASSSSVYGVNPNVPWREDDHVLMPISPYASTKVSGELLGHVYSHLYGIRFIALRFFTVYGPRQRPDLAICKFARLIHDGHDIPIFGDGSTRRDYTYVSDIVKGLRAAISYAGSPYEIINLGNNRTISLAEMVSCLEEALETRALISRQPEQPGDVPQTWADISKAHQLLEYRPEVDFQAGIRGSVEWARSHLLTQSVMANEMG